MYIKIFSTLLSSSWLLSPLVCSEGASSSTPYHTIRDIRHPTLNDYRAIQHYLNFGTRSRLKLLGSYEANARNLVLIGKRKDEIPRAGMIAVHSKKSERENCVILYSSFNKNYPRGLKRLIKHIARSDFKGHILYRFGGWPNVEGGSLKLAHVPYAFKVSFFQEARRKGYKRVLWLDAALIPLVSLNTIFKTIQEKGHFVMGNSHTVGPFMNSKAAAAFGLSLQETQVLPSCSAGLFGVDFTNKRSSKVIDEWYRKAFDKDAYFSARSEQNALSIILYKAGISDFVSIHKLAHNKSKITPDSLFLIQRSYVKKSKKSTGMPPTN